MQTTHTRLSLIFNLTQNTLNRTYDPEEFHNKGFGASLKPYAMVTNKTAAVRFQRFANHRRF